MKKLFLYICAVALAFQSHAQKIQDSTFVMTVGLGDMSKVKTLLKKGTHPNAMTGGATALRWADYNGFTEIVNLLKTAGAKEQKE